MQADEKKPATMILLISASPALNYKYACESCNQPGLPERQGNGRDKEKIADCMMGTPK